MKSNIVFIIIFLIKIHYILSQEIPQEFFRYKSQKIIFDSGEEWEHLTNFSPLRFNRFKISKHADLDSSNFKLGLSKKDNSIALYGFGKLSYKNNIYGYLYPRIVNNPNSFVRHTGIINNDSVAIESDISGFGYSTDWITLEICRGRESWGAGNNIQLALNANSPPYDYFMLWSDYGKIRVNYIHGFLESTDNGINRYITARGIEYSNRDNFIVGFSETVIYSGYSRPMDIGYINPISMHLEVELNDRLNVLGSNSANAVWQIHIDYLLKKKLRLSFNYLYDELVLDPSLEIGKENGTAYSLRTVYNLVKSPKNILNLSANMIVIGTPTFRHSYGTNNFVQRGYPIGFDFGSDGIEYGIEINYYKPKNIIFTFGIGTRKIGQEAIINRHFDGYKDYLKGAFPSGNVIQNDFINISSELMLNNWLSIISNISLEKYYNKNNSASFNVGFNSYLPIGLSK
mgnify:CR=1 FL=1